MVPGGGRFGRGRAATTRTAGGVPTAAVDANRARTRRAAAGGQDRTASATRRADRSGARRGSSVGCQADRGSPGGLGVLQLLLSVRPNASQRKLLGDRGRDFLHIATVTSSSSAIDACRDRGPRRSTIVCWAALTGDRARVLERDRAGPSGVSARPLDLRLGRPLLAQLGDDCLHSRERLDGLARLEARGEREHRRVGVGVGRPSKPSRRARAARGSRRTGASPSTPQERCE